MQAANYAVFGNPIAHSLSPEIHQRFAAQTGDTIHYTRELVEVDGFENAVQQFFAAGGAGINITAPFKLRACTIASDLSIRAKKAGAVNTLLVKNNALFGDNTDGAGLCRDISDNLGWMIHRASLMLVGAGGAARGVLLPLLEHKPRQIIIVNRTVEKAQQLAKAFASDADAAGCKLIAMSFSDLDALAEKFDIVINASSASLQGDLPPLPAAIVGHARCYDMMYAKTPTDFLRWAAQQGARAVADGLGMLVEQAAEAYFLWHGTRPDTKPVINALRSGL